jgi:hypothetical protein
MFRVPECVVSLRGKSSGVLLERADLGQECLHARFGFPQPLGCVSELVFGCSKLVVACSDFTQAATATQHSLERVAALLLVVAGHDGLDCLAVPRRPAA